VDRFKLLLLLLLLPGCIAGGYAVELGPVVDFDGNVGVLLRSQLSVGIASGDDIGYRLAPNAGIGVDAVRGRGMFMGGTGMDFVAHDLTDVELGIRAGIRTGWLGEAGDMGVSHDMFFGFPVALLIPLDRKSWRGHEKWGGGGTAYKCVGVAIEPLIRSVGEDEEMVGAIYGAAVWEVDSFSWW
jgi:hypothetical protein